MVKLKPRNDAHPPMRMARVAAWFRRERARSREQREFREKVILTVLDKAVLGLGIVLASAVASTVFGAKLEAIKTADAQRLELTKRQIDSTTKTYERTTRLIDEADAQYLKTIDSLMRCQDEKDEHTFVTCKASVLGPLFDRKRAIRFSTEPTADDMWIEPELRGVLMEYRSKADDYRGAAVERFEACLWDKSTWESAHVSFRLAVPISDCFADVNKARGLAVAFRKDIQTALDRYLDRTTVTPGLVEQWFGRRQTMMPGAR